MSSGTKVYKYRCTTCERTVEVVSDNRRPDPVRCIITDQCRGTLEPTGSRRGDRAKLTTPSSELTDRVPRGSSLMVTEAPADPVYVNMSSFASSNGFTLASIRRVEEDGFSVFKVVDSEGSLHEIERRAIGSLYPTLTSVDMMVYELTPAVLSSQRYTFTFTGSAQVLEGVDDSKEQRLLRFSSAYDTVVVLANGVELEASEYNKDVDNTIRLTPSITAAEITLEVYIFRDRTAQISEDSLLRLTFSPLSETDDDELLKRTGCAWGDISRINADVERSLLFCTDLTLLEQQKTYSIARFEVTNGTDVHELEPSECWLLLSDPPHSFVDKRLDAYINGSTLIEQQFIFSYDLSEATGDLVPTTLESSLTVLTDRLNPVAEANATPSSTAGSERSYEKRAQAFIIGPA